MIKTITLKKQVTVLKEFIEPVHRCDYRLEEIADHVLPEGTVISFGRPNMISLPKEEGGYMSYVVPSYLLRYLYSL